MNDNETIYAKYENDTGEEFYCPIQAVSDNRIVSEWELDNCVEASVVGRYAGSLKVMS